LRERRLTKVVAVRFDAATADFLDGQADPSTFIRQAVRQAIVKSQGDSENTDTQVVAWHTELKTLQHELDEIRMSKDEVGRDLTRMSVGEGAGEDEDVARRVYDAQKGREAALERRMAELKRRILEA